MKNRVLNIMVKIFGVLVIIGIVIFGTSVYLSAKDKNKTDEEKVEEEIDYLEAKITDLINTLNGIQLANYKVVVSKVEKNNSSSSESSSSSGQSEGEGQGQGQDSKSEEEKDGEEDSSKENTTITKMEKDLLIGNSEEINWEWMKGEIEVFYSVWSQIVLDLYNKGVSSDKILEFSDNLDNAVLSIKNSDKKSSAINLAKLYNIIPDFSNHTSSIDEIKKNTLQTKKYILNAYANVDSENWEGVNSETEKAERAFMQAMNNIGKEGEKKKYNINKTYILLEELKNSISKKDTEIFYIKYKNLLEEINVLI